jgi:hypothetical protein
MSDPLFKNRKISRIRRDSAILSKRRKYRAKKKGCDTSFKKEGTIERIRRVCSSLKK